MTAMADGRRHFADGATGAPPSPSLSVREPATARRRLRSLFVSDLHLGYKGADIEALNALLATCEMQHLYLVGDILDGWKLEKRWYWTQAYCDFVDTLMTLRRRRVRITLITGNHDEKLREILPKLLRPLALRRFGLRIEERATHRAAGGARLLVTHGDEFDGLLWRGASKTADRLYGWLTERRAIRPPRPERRWSLGRAIAREGAALADRYAAAALRRTRCEGVDGIVFGHSHVPMLENRDGLWLANCGAWTRPIDGRHSAIAEDLDGRLALLRWPATQQTRDDVAPPVPAALRVRDPDSARLIRHIHALWRPADARPRFTQVQSAGSIRRGAEQARADPAPAEAHARPV
ncbi:MAG: UDP-2,3-diacylglucosamine diphosphatase [Rhodobacteraceae bacterium]|nr:MAG: UDP-2,3-diacylglucosamine diphosphatase [Paracoccaceae bacterium]